MQYTPDLLQDWVWIPAVVSGHGETKTWAFDVAGEKGFWRLVSCDIPTDDPPGDDFDGDGVSNLAELLQGTHPLENFDNDHDGFSDDWETGAGLNPSDATDGANADSDSDGLTNAEERLAGTLMQNPDSDGDGVEDGRDGWAKNPTMSPVRLPGTSYAALALDQLGLPYIAPADLYEALYTADMNDQGLIRMKDATGGFFFVPWTGQVFRFPAGHTIRSYMRMSNLGEIVSSFGLLGQGVWRYTGTWTPIAPHAGPLGPGQSRNYVISNGWGCLNASGALVAEISGESVQDPPPYDNPVYAEKWGYRGHGFWLSNVTQPPGTAHHYHHRFYYDFGTNQFNQITTGGTWLSPRYLNDQNLATGGVRQVAGGTRSSAEQFSDGTTGPFMVQTLGPGLTEAGGAPQILSGGVEAWVDVSSQDSTYLVGGREIGYTGYYEPLLWQKRDGAWQMINLAETVPDMNFVWDVNSRGQFIGSIQRGEEYREVLVENGAVVKLDEKLAPSGWKDVFPQLITESGVILAAATKTQDQTPHGVLLVPVDIAVDSNRDGEIKFAGNYNDEAVAGKPADVTTQDNPLRFWINNDQDSDSADGGEIIPVAIPNCDDQYINGSRDLEDMMRMHVYLGGICEAVRDGKILIGFKWQNMTGNPAINLFSACEENGKTEYLSNDGVALRQAYSGLLQNNPVGSLIERDGTLKRISAGSDFVVHSSQWSKLVERNGCAYFLLEACAEGKGQLIITFHKPDGTKIGEGPSVWLDLKNIKKMYERTRVLPEEAADPYAYTGPNNDPPSLGYALQADIEDHVFEPDPEEDLVHKNYIVFVHGWRMAYSERICFSETMFKRLWHRGYKGRFAAFIWPTYSNGFPIVEISAYLSKFNESEYRAWSSGEFLKQYMDGLPSGYVKNLVAHSMGNIVAGSALSQGMIVDNYALLNGATPATCYDTSGSLYQPIDSNVPNPAGDLLPDLTYWNYITMDDDSDVATRALAYKGRMQSASGNLVNFYLSFDEATTSGWEFNNYAGKPVRFNGLPPITGVSGYEYDPSRNPRYKVQLTFLLSNARLVQTPYEVMSMVNQSRTKPVGAEPRTRGSISDNPVDLNQNGMNFGVEHSAEFTFRIQQLRPFYNELLRTFNITPNP